MKEFFRRKGPAVSIVWKLIAYYIEFHYYLVTKKLNKLYRNEKERIDANDRTCSYKYT